MSVHPTDYLVHFSNILLLVSYSVRNILWLRWFAVAAALTNMPYFLYQPSKVRRFTGVAGVRVWQLTSRGPGAGRGGRRRRVLVLAILRKARQCSCRWGGSDSLAGWAREMAHTLPGGR